MPAARETRRRGLKVSEIFADSSGNGLQQEYDRVWGLVASHFRNNPWVIGYDLFNEPFSDEVATPGGNQTFDARLECFYTGSARPGKTSLGAPLVCPPTDPSAGVIPTIERDDPNHLIFYELDVGNDFGQPNWIGPMPFPRLVLDFHDYCLPTSVTGALPGPPANPLGPALPSGTSSQAALDAACRQEESLVFTQEARARAAAATSFQPGGPAWFLSELGAGCDLVDLAHVAGLADTNLASWTYWQWKDYGDPTGGGNEGVFNNCGKPGESPKVPVLSRPYAQAVAGTPTAMSFDLSTDTFHLSYVPDHATRAPSIVFLPLSVHYPNGYCATATGARVVATQPRTLSGFTSGRLLVYDERAAPAVEVTIAPGSCRAHGGVPGSPACPLAMAPRAQVSPPGGKPFTICTGKIPSFDGTPLDTDLSLPDARASSGPRPLIVMMHGWGGSKSDFESTTLPGGGQNTYDWNNAWFASHGFAVLTYTARGFAGSCGKDPSAGYTYATDPACAGKASWTHLADRRFEIHDTQYLVGLLVDAGVANPSKIVVTGDSYGGGQSWLLALSQNKVMEPDGSLVPWTSPRGVRVHLAAAVPQFPWTDLVQALVDNGRASDGYFGAPADASHVNPIGVEKESYVDGLYALGLETAQYAPPSDASADLSGWFAGISAGEPYRTDPLAQQAITQLERYRSPYYMPVPPHRNAVPVLDLQGVTDPLFPGIQALEMINRLRASQPGYPVWAIFGDLGHSYATNPHALWVEVNGDANRWLDDVLTGRHPRRPRFTVVTVSCDASEPAVTYQAPTFTLLDNKVLTLSATKPQATSSATPPGTEAATVEPVEGSTASDAIHASATSCVRMPISSDRGVASWTLSPEPATSTSAVTIIGSPILRAPVTVTGPDAVVAARLWDVDPRTGEQTLVARAVYRISTGLPTWSGILAFELWPTAWRLAPGHELVIEATRTDSPTWRPDNLPSTILWSTVSVTLPVRT